jgi:hypothetical protein
VGIDEALQHVCEVLHSVYSAIGTGATECAAHHGMALEPFGADWYHYIGQGKYLEPLITT